MMFYVDINCALYFFIYLCVSNSRRFVIAVTVITRFALILSQLSDNGVLRSLSPFSPLVFERKVFLMLSPPPLALIFFHFSQLRHYSYTTSSLPQMKASQQ